MIELDSHTIEQPLARRLRYLRVLLWKIRSPGGGGFEQKIAKGTKVGAGRTSPSGVKERGFVVFVTICKRFVRAAIWGRTADREGNEG